MFYLLVYSALLIGQSLFAIGAPNAHNKAGEPVVVVNQNVYESPKAVETVTVKALKPISTITISTTSTVTPVEEVVHSTSTFTTTAPALVIVNQNAYESPKAVETVTVHDNNAGKPDRPITIFTTSTVGAVVEVEYTTSTSTHKNIPTTVSVITVTATAPAPVVVNQNAPSPKAVETVTVHVRDVRPSPRAVSQVTVTVRDVPAAAPSPKTITKVEEPAVNSALPPTVVKTVVKSTKTPVNFTEDFKTWYMWEHIGPFKGKKGKRSAVKYKGWRVPTGFPTTSKPEIGGERLKREVENVDIITSFTTLTFTAAPAPAPTPPAQQQQQPPQQPPQQQQLLPGQIPITRSDTDGIAVVPRLPYPENFDQGVHQFRWDADHPERVEIGGEYATLVSTLVKYTPPPPPPTPQPQPAPQPRQETQPALAPAQQSQPAQQQQQQQQQPASQPAQQQEDQPRAITFTLPGKTEHVVMTLKTTITTARTLVSVFPVTLSVSDAADASPSVSTSLLTIPAGQIGNKEATVVSVLVPVENTSSAAVASVVPVEATIWAGPSVVTSLLTIPAGQIGNKEATVVSVLVPAAAATPVQLAPVAPAPVAPPASAPPASAPPASAPPASTPSTPSAVAPAVNTTASAPPASTPSTPSAVAPAVNTTAPAADTPAANTPATPPAQMDQVPAGLDSVSVNVSVSVSEGSQDHPQEKESPKAQKQEKNNVEWETVVPGQDVVVNGSTVEVVAVITGGPATA